MWYLRKFPISPKEKALARSNRDEVDLRVRPTTVPDLASLRERYRSEAACQIVRYSILPRGLADPYLFTAEGEAAGFAGVWSKHFPDRITEFYLLPEFRSFGPRLVRILSEASGATELEVQTNILAGEDLLRECARPVWVENILFHEGSETDVVLPGVVFRRRRATDEGPEGQWVVEENGRVVGAGGWLTHYNAPYADIYLEVEARARAQGIGGFLAQGLRRACSTAGYRPAARCDPKNIASRRALERGGLEVCGRILAGTLTGRAA